MTRTLFAAISGTFFGLVLGASVYHFHTHSACHRSMEPTVVPAVVRVEAPPMHHPCTRAVVADDRASEVVATTQADIDAQADLGLAQARRLAQSDPAQARVLCRQVMKLYNNNPRNERVRTAFKLLNSTKPTEDDDF